MPDISAARPIAGAPIETAWGDEIHDQLEGLQAGTVPLTVTAVARYDYTLTFPRAYAAAPTVIVGVVGGNTNLVGLVGLPSTTQVVIGVFRRDGANLTAGSVTITWLAIGTPA